MQKIKDLINKYYEGLAYLFFGGLATLLNLVVFAVFQAALGTAFATGIGNILDNVICILFAYWTNRTFVFKSQNTGKAAWAEFGQFVSCRIATMVMDQVIIWVGVSLLGPHVGFAVANAKLWAMGVKLFSQQIVLVFKVAKFALHHPLLTHEAKRLVHKKLRPKKEASPMKQKVRGHAFRLVGLILGIIGATVSITSIVFAALGLHQARLCKHCDKGENFR